MKLKRVIASLLCAAAVLGLVGCGNAKMEPEVSQKENAFYVKPVDEYKPLAGKEAGIAMPVSYKTDTIGSFDAESGTLVIDNCSEIPRMDDNVVKDGKTKVRTLVIEGNVETIGESAFRDWSALETVTIKESVHTIDDAAFLGCTKLTKVSLGEYTKQIGRDAFSGCRELTRVTLGSHVETIGKNVFKDCGITEFTTGSDVQAELFNGCTTLQTVVLEDTVHKIGKNAFSGCTGLNKVVVSAELESIESYAFSGCEKLKEIWLPKTLKHIGERFLAGTRLDHIRYEWDTEHWGKIKKDKYWNYDCGKYEPNAREINQARS